MEPEDKEIVEPELFEEEEEEEEIVEPETPEPPEPPVEEDKDVKEPEFSFKSQEDLDKAIATGVEATLEAKEAARLEEEKAKVQPPEEDFFDKDFVAKDWNEAAKTMYPKFKERLLKEQEMTAKERQDQLTKINKEFDEEIENLAKEDKEIPVKGTPERTDWDKEISKIGIEYPVKNMTQAYNIWKALKGTKPKNDIPEKQKDLASKISRGGGEGTPVKQRSHQELSNRSMDELIDDDLASLGVKD